MLKLIAIILLLAGCTSMGNQNMSPDQLKAVAADKNFSAVCSTITGVWGSGKFVYVNVDKTVVPNGTVSVTQDCIVSMSETQIFRPVTPMAPIPVVVPVTVIPVVPTPGVQP